MKGDASHQDLQARDNAPQVAQICNFWKEFELEAFRSKLDEKGLAVAENQEASVKSRRRLADTTKEFKRTANAEVAKQVSTLLKSYQEEIDRLTNRAKFGESAFLDVYQKLYEAPDPAPSLSSALELASRGAELQAQVRKMAQELAEYKAESKELKNQDGTIRRLEERVRTLDAQLQEKDRQLEEAAAAAEAAGNLRDAEEAAAREKALVGALSEAQSSVNNLQRLHEASQKQMFNMQSRSEEEQVAMQGELEIATAEMERAHERLMALEKEKQVLVEQMSSTEHLERVSQPHDKTMEANLRAELSKQRELATRLHSELGALTARTEEEAAAASARCEGLRDALRAQEAHADALERELQSRPTAKQMDELRQQIRVLQAVGYGSLEGDEGQEGAPESSSMEALLMGKNRHLEHELTMARLQVAEISGEAEAAAARVSDLEAEVARQTSLVARLEEDLLAAEHSGQGRDPKANGTANGHTHLPLLEDSNASGTGTEEAAEPTMVSVLCSQRDRFRKRNTELEEELAQTSGESRSVKRELDAARADNVSLVERLRYVQGYQASSRARYDVERGDIESKYATAYEEKLNPFSDWKERERAARKRQLNVADRVMYEFGQFISSSQKARVFVVVYTLALHLLIFWVLARWGHGPSHHFGAAELQLLCTRQAHDSAAAAVQHNGKGLGTADLIDSSFGSQRTLL